ncbi:hypothetical protein M9H77_06801 [Catharanthus roseus]|uniref:Uncharacterized protein n=1 Tax=Catharanthus roseus TaxID=4058 RepID=A0ACC0BTC6_CATRO|nr:hypothetical protein M9H77_06801 [Catharanthus roseus]
MIRYKSNNLTTQNKELRKLETSQSSLQLRPTSDGRSQPTVRGRSISSNLLCNLKYIGDSSDKPTVATFPRCSSSILLAIALVTGPCNSSTVPCAFRELLLKEFENQMGVNLELFKVNTLAFENSNLRKETFEQEFFDIVGSKEKCRPSWNVGNFMFTFSHFILCNTIGEKRCLYAKESELIEAIGKGKLVSLPYCKEELGGLSLLKEMGHQIEWLHIMTICSCLLILTPLSIDHALSMGEVKKMGYFKYIHFKDHDAIATIHKTFERK